MSSTLYNNRINNDIKTLIFSTRPTSISSAKYYEYIELKMIPKPTVANK